MMGLVPFYEHDETRGLTFCCVKTQAGDSFCEPGSRHQNAAALISRTVRDTRLWYLVIAAPADQDKSTGVITGTSIALWPGQCPSSHQGLRF